MMLDHLLHHRRDRERVLREMGAVAIGPDGIPAAFDALLAAPEADLFSSRLWYETTQRHGLPAGTRALMAEVGPPGTMVVPLLSWDSRFSSLTTIETPHWRPLTASWAGDAAMEAAAGELGKMLRGRPPTLFRAMDCADAVVQPLRSGLQRAGLWTRIFKHFGNCYEALPRGLRWADYLGMRDAPLRRALEQRRAEWETTTQSDLLIAPGAALEAGIADFLSLRAAAQEPGDWTPDFHAALMRGTAEAGLLRLGVLRLRREGRPLAAQYWILSGGQATLMHHAHLPAARPSAPWMALTAAMMTRLLDEDVEAIDLGRGDEPYKRLWARARRQRIGMLVADPRHPAGALALARHAAGRARKRLMGLFAGPAREEEPYANPL